MQKWQDIPEDLVKKKSTAPESPRLGFAEGFETSDTVAILDHIELLGIHDIK